MLPGPLTRISPSSAIFSSTPGTGLPTVRKRCSRSVFEQTPEVVSVRPQPFKIGTPSAQKNSSISLARPAPPPKKKPHPPAGQKVSNGGRDEPVRQTSLGSQHGTRLRRHGEARARTDRPFEDRLSDRTRIAHAGHHGRIHLFVDARDAEHDRRLDLVNLFREVVLTPRDPGLAAVQQAVEDVVDAAEDV